MTSKRPIDIAFDQHINQCWSEEWIKEYLGSEYKPGYNWCAGFVSWCVEQAGLEAPKDGRAKRGAKACLRWFSFCPGASWIIHPDEPSLSPAVLNRLPESFDYQKYTYIVCWNRNMKDPSSWEGHIAFFGDRDETNLIVEPETIGGNEGFKIKTWQKKNWWERAAGLYGLVRIPNQ